MKKGATIDHVAQLTKAHIIMHDNSHHIREKVGEER